MGRAPSNLLYYKDLEIRAESSIHFGLTSLYKRNVFLPGFLWCHAPTLEAKIASSWGVGRPGISAVSAQFRNVSSNCESNWPVDERMIPAARAWVRPGR